MTAHRSPGGVPSPPCPPLRLPLRPSAHFPLLSLLSFLSFLSFLLVLCSLLYVSPVRSLTVHMVPHTHDDVGWLKTVDQYFIGSNDSLQHASVTNLITATVAALQRVPERKFVYVEQAFFQRWWREQNDAMKAEVRALVKNGQLEFINGGWCMHDEAATHYVDMIDQTTLGHQYILQQFGESANPTIGWQVDPFGHSATQPTLLGHEIGFNALFFGRIDYQDHAQRVQNKEMQFSWAPSPSLGPTSQVWTEVALDGNYNPPAGLCWDYLCNSEKNPFVQDRDDLEDKNVESRVADFIKAAYQYAATRKGDLATMNVQFNMGTDFNYESAEQYFINMDKIIAGVNRNGTVHAQYSTPSLYYKAKMAEGIQWSVKTDDFFPYASSAGNQWTGYFTSRPGLKGYVRSSSITLQTARQLEVFSGGDGTGTEAAWEAIAVAQHHDAVAGTERQHVAYDYAQRIAKGMAVAYRTLDAALSELSANGSSVVAFHSCPLLNVSICPTIRSTDSFTVLLYNPQPRESRASLHLPLHRAGNVTVVDSAGRNIPCDVVPVPRTSAHTNASLPYSLVVTPTVPGLGFVTLFVRIHSPSTRLRHLQRPPTPTLLPPTASTVSIENGVIRLTFNNDTGLIEMWTDLVSGTVHPFSQNFFWYESSVNESYGVSNLYRFQPTRGTRLFNVSDKAVQLTVHDQGTQVQLVHQRWNDWLSQTWWLYNGSTSPEVEWTIGPIDKSDNRSREVVTRYTTDIASRGEWWTDANGREFQRRVRNHRPSFNFTLVSPISSNYYPVTTSARLNDSERAFGVLIDRAEGAASLEDGAIEIMLHRRLLCVACGMEDEDETDSAIYANGQLVERVGVGLIVLGRHRLVLLPLSQATTALREGQQRLYRPLHPVFAPTNDTAETWKAAGRVGELSFLQTELPPSVELMTLQVLFDGSVLLRLAHQFAVGEPGSAPVTVDLSTLFVQPIKTIKQRTLTANADYKGRLRERLPYETDREVSEEEWDRIDSMHQGLQNTTITLYPMQIAAFAISF